MRWHHFPRPADLNSRRFEDSRSKIAPFRGQDPVADAERWEVRYVLLLWLSILVIVPFALNSVDSGAGGPPPHGSIYSSNMYQMLFDND